MTIYTHKYTKIRINNHPLLYIHINTHNNYHKKYAQRHPKYFTVIPIKLLKKIIFFLVCIKMDQENIMFFKNQNESYIIVDLYQNRVFGYKDS